MTDDADAINAAVNALVAVARKEEREKLESRLSLAEKVVEAAAAKPWIKRGQPGDDFEFGCEGCASVIVNGRVVHGSECLFGRLTAALAAIDAADKE